MLAVDALQLLANVLHALGGLAFGLLVVLEHLLELGQLGAQALVFLGADAGLNLLLQLLDLGQLDHVFWPKLAAGLHLLLDADQFLDGPVLHVAQLEELLLKLGFLLVDDLGQALLADNFQLHLVTAAGLRKGRYIVVIVRASLDDNRLAFDGQPLERPALRKLEAGGFTRGSPAAGVRPRAARNTGRKALARSLS